MVKHETWNELKDTPFHASLAKVFQYVVCAKFNILEEIQYVVCAKFRLSIFRNCHYDCNEYKAENDALTKNAKFSTCN